LFNAAVGLSDAERSELWAVALSLSRGDIAQVAKDLGIGSEALS
jgi:hypothetical protein